VAELFLSLFYMAAYSALLISVFSAK